MESCPSRKQNNEKRQGAGNVRRKKEGEACGIMENETARETEMAKRDKVWVMCSEGERERPMASWKMKRRGKLKWRQARSPGNNEGERRRCRRRGGKRNGEATKTKCQRREGKVMYGEGKRETPAAVRETDWRDGRK
ncbi:hypothetical protein ACOSQ3_025022 [Xanthoceras sorbifolium]